MQLNTPKGMRDIPPEEKIIRNDITNKLRNIFELYGFVPLETPLLERYDILSAKYTANAEILNETFKLQDQGKRELGLRYDLTVPFARYIGSNPAMKMPFKRYQMGKVFRDGPIKAGRAREFWQCDVDIVGTKSMIADAECINIFQRGFKELKLDVTIEINNKKLLNGILKSCEVPQGLWGIAITEIDKIKKVGMETVVKELNNQGIGNEATTRLVEILGTQGTNFEKLESIKTLCDNEESAEGIKELQELLLLINDSNVELSLGLARGQAYYTGTLIEVFLKKGKITSSLGGGGRYDTLISNYLESKKEYPAVGVSFGIEPISLALTKSIEQVANVSTVFIVSMDTNEESMKVAEQLRNENINVEMDLMGRNMGKNMKYILNKKIPWLIVIGSDEVKQKKVSLKNLESGENEVISVTEAINAIKNKKHIHSGLLK